ncbi:MAG: MICOS complex subunit MIC60 [Candidatus Thiodiazotropha weberae]|nr:MICOS complex subunit MIC60 [Candidatus Thiodiazotropha lotti]MCG8021547.1 MICOS complex subunit MIC60 [Candidatus Thiodiazotropha lotti]MCW4208715.1 MICOS complex subunit MIC60 [Candidatus Thiodiazotropha lotti]MCW4216729.1 MICOS complex subunit MIC60 [Candidatus Thiodiazotropha lotti]
MQYNPFRIGNSGRPGQLLRILQALLLALLLSACSRIQLAYNNLDWLLPHYLSSYMPLSDNQDSLLEAGVENFLHWHCSTQVTNYAHLLREVDRRFRSDDLIRTELITFNDRVQQAWTGILQQGSPALGVILLTADETQIRELFKGFEERNSEWLEEFEATSDEELRDDYRERMSKELQRWFGELDERQEQLLVVWSRRFQPLGLQGLEVRRRWQSRLQEIMNARNDPEAFQREFAELLTNPGTLRTPVYQQRLDHNRDVTIDMLYTIALQLSDAQKHHLKRQVKAVAGDFDGLACSGEPVAS